MWSPWREGEYEPTWAESTAQRLDAQGGHAFLYDES